MKILAIGRNYADHIKELQNEVPADPVIFLKPDTALLKNNAPFYYPSFSQNIHYEVELIIRISKEGKNIKENFAYKYFDRIGLGIDFTARDLQDNLKANSLPWTLAKGFNGSAPISEFIMANEFVDLNAISFSLNVNGIERQKGFSGNMINNFSKIISFISKYITLKNGDIIFTGTPAGVGSVQIGERLEGYIDGKKMLDFEVK